MLIEYTGYSVNYAIVVVIVVKKNNKDSWCLNTVGETHPWPTRAF